MTVGNYIKRLREGGKYVEILLSEGFQGLLGLQRFDVLIANCQVFC
jgi:hypothetical protein